MEAALQDRGVDYRDRWRDDPVTGRPVLTLRRIAVLVLRHMPEGSPVAEAIAGYRPVSRLEEMVDDVRRSVQMSVFHLGSKDPALHPDRERALEQARKSEAARLERLAHERRERRRRELASMKGD